MSVKTIVGRLGGVPEIRAAGSKHVAVFDVAETKRRFNRDTQQWEDAWTIWHSCEAWSNVNAIGQLAKGTLVIIEGEEKDASYQSRDTGKKVSKVKVDVRNLGTLVVESNRGSAPAQQSTESWAQPSGGGWDDGTPF